MMFYMTSKTFFKHFIQNESDKAILDAYYIMVSSRIRRRDRRFEDHVVSGMSSFVPSSNVLSYYDDKDIMKRMYYEQLDNQSGTIANLIEGSIEENYNVIFIATDKPVEKLSLKWLSQYILLEYDYPVYEYKDYASGKYELYKFDKKKVLKKCKKILKENKDEQRKRLVKSASGMKMLKQEINAMTKAELKKEVKKMDLYRDGMSKSDMRELVELFLD